MYGDTIDRGHERERAGRHAADQGSVRNVRKERQDNPDRGPIPHGTGDGHQGLGPSRHGDPRHAAMVLGYPVLAAQ